MKNDNPLYDHLDVFCKKCGKNTGIKARELMVREYFECPRCGAVVGAGACVRLEQEIAVKAKPNPELAKDIDEIFCSRCKKILQITKPNCPFHILATVLCPPGAGNMACTQLECAIWDRQRRCCGLIQK